MSESILYFDRLFNGENLEDLAAAKGISEEDFVRWMYIARIKPDMDLFNKTCLEKRYWSIVDVSRKLFEITSLAELKRLIKIWKDFEKAYFSISGPTARIKMLNEERRRFEIEDEERRTKTKRYQREYLTSLRERAAEVKKRDKEYHRRLEREKEIARQAEENRRFIIEEEKKKVEREQAEEKLRRERRIVELQRLEEERLEQEKKKRAEEVSLARAALNLQDHLEQIVSAERIAKEKAKKLRRIEREKARKEGVQNYSEDSFISLAQAAKQLGMVHSTRGAGQRDRFLSFYKSNQREIERICPDCPSYEEILAENGLEKRYLDVVSQLYKPRVLYAPEGFMTLFRAADLIGFSHSQTGKANTANFLKFYRNNFLEIKEICPDCPSPEALEKKQILKISDAIKIKNYVEESRKGCPEDSLPLTQVAFQIGMLDSRGRGHANNFKLYYRNNYSFIKGWCPGCPTPEQLVDDNCLKRDYVSIIGRIYTLGKRKKKS